MERYELLILTPFCSSVVYWTSFPYVSSLPLPSQQPPLPINTHLLSLFTQGPGNCIRCRNYTLVTQSGSLCVASCPLGTYANGTMCTPCYQGCTAGCAGPLPYVNLTNGCLKCSYVQLNQQGQQVGMVCFY